MSSDDYRDLYDVEKPVSAKAELDSQARLELDMEAYEAAEKPVSGAPVTPIFYISRNQ